MWNSHRIFITTTIAWSTKCRQDSRRCLWLSLENVMLLRKDEICREYPFADKSISVNFFVLRYFRSFVPLFIRFVFCYSFSRFTWDFFMIPLSFMFYPIDLNLPASIVFLVFVVIVVLTSTIIFLHRRTTTTTPRISMTVYCYSSGKDVEWKHMSTSSNTYKHSCMPMYISVG